MIFKLHSMTHASVSVWHKISSYEAHLNTAASYRRPNATLEFASEMLRYWARPSQTCWAAGRRYGTGSGTWRWPSSCTEQTAADVPMTRRIASVRWRATSVLHLNWKLNGSEIETATRSDPLRPGPQTGYGPKATRRSLNRAKCVENKCSYAYKTKDRCLA